MSDAFDHSWMGLGGLCVVAYDEDVGEDVTGTEGRDVVGWAEWSGVVVVIGFGGLGIGLHGTCDGSLVMK